MRNELSRSDIPGYKYNYALDKEVQNLSCQKAHIRLSKDFKFFYINNLKPNEAFVQHTLETDPAKIKQQMKEAK